MALQDNALVSLEELKAGLKGITQSDQDPILETIINATADALETHTGRRLKTRSYANLYVYIRPGQVMPGGCEWLDVEWPITALTALSIHGTAQTIWMPGDAGDPDAKDVFLLEGRDPKHARDRLYRPSGWIAGLLVKMSYTAGYGVAGFPIPEDLKQPAIVLARDWYHLRARQAENVQSRSIAGEAVTYVNDALPRQFRALIGSYKRWTA